MKLNFKDYSDKVLGCYLGKNAGGTLGAPFECYRGVYDLEWFAQDISRPIPNDDLDLQLVWLRAVETEGARIDSHILTEYWNTYIVATLCEYGTGKNNFNLGIAPPVSGNLRNPNRHSNGAWIRTEIWACLAAGDPWKAATYAYYDSSVDHCGEGVYAAVFLAAVEAAAFFEQDIGRLIDIGLSYLPADCGVRRAVDTVLDARARGLTWQETRKLLFKEVGCSFGRNGGEWQGTAEVPACAVCPKQTFDPEIPETPLGYDAPWSIGAILCGLLWGEGDFGKSVCTAVNMGEDTDCTAGVVGSIYGIIHGAKGIPEKWKKACSEEIATWTLRTDMNLLKPKTISELVERIVKLSPEVRRTTRPPTSDGCLDPEQLLAVECAPELRYRKGLYPASLAEDPVELLKEQGKTVRRHYPLFTATVTFDETSVEVFPNAEKRLTVKFYNRLFTPQYLTVRVLGLPEDWHVAPSPEFAVGLEHWHGGRNDNAVELQIRTGDLKQARYDLVLEISSNGRGTKSYFPLTFLVGACR